MLSWESITPLGLPSKSFSGKIFIQWLQFIEDPTSSAGCVDQGGALVDGDTPEPGLKTSIIQAVASVEEILRCEAYKV